MELSFFVIPSCVISFRTPPGWFSGWNIRTTDLELQLPCAASPGKKRRRVGIGGAVRREAGLVARPRSSAALRRRRRVNAACSGRSAASWGGRGHERRDGESHTFHGPGGPTRSYRHGGCEHSMVWRLASDSASGHSWVSLTKPAQERNVEVDTNNQGSVEDQALSRCRHK